MPLEMSKKDILYSNLIKELDQKYLSKYEGQEIDIMEIISLNNLEIENLMNEEHNCIGIFIEKLTIKQQVYLLLANCMKGLNIIKIHDYDFFDETCLVKNKLILLTNFYYSIH